MNNELVKKLISDLIELRKRDWAICDEIKKAGGPRIIPSRDNVQVYKGFDDLVRLYEADVKAIYWNSKTGHWGPHTTLVFDLDETDIFTIIREDKK